MIVNRGMNGQVSLGNGSFGFWPMIISALAPTVLQQFQPSQTAIIPPPSNATLVIGLGFLGLTALGGLAYFVFKT